jgi:hypothetical protein
LTGFSCIKNAMTASDWGTQDITCLYPNLKGNKKSGPIVPAQPLEAFQYDANAL